MHRRQVDRHNCPRIAAPQSTLWHGDHVRRRRHGRGGHLREFAVSTLHHGGTENTEKTFRSKVRFGQLSSARSFIAVGQSTSARAYGARRTKFGLAVSVSPRKPDLNDAGARPWWAAPVVNTGSRTRILCALRASVVKKDFEVNQARLGWPQQR